MATLNTEQQTVRRSIWHRINKDRQQSGDFQVRCDERYTTRTTGDYEFQRWYIYIRKNKRWKRVFPSQRKYGYGSAGQAKIGAALMAKKMQER